MQCGRHICSGAYVSNMKFMYTSSFGDIVDYIEFIWCIYTAIVILDAHEVNGI